MEKIERKGMKNIKEEIEKKGEKEGVLKVNKKKRWVNRKKWMKGEKKS